MVSVCPTPAPLLPGRATTPNSTCGQYLLTSIAAVPQSLLVKEAEHCGYMKHRSRDDKLDEFTAGSSAAFGNDERNVRHASFWTSGRRLAQSTHTHTC